MKGVRLWFSKLERGLCWFFQHSNSVESPAGRGARLSALNWRNVFAPFFDRQDSVCESFQRLYLVRLDTMHARPITQDDKMLLHVETRRLVKVMIGKIKK